MKGPEESTGRFSTRVELENYARRLHQSSTMTRKEMADDCEISVGTLQSILKGGDPEGEKEFLKLKTRLLRCSNWSAWT